MKLPLLFIDDDETFLYTLTRSLQRRGEEVLAAKNAEEALSHLNNSNPDRVILDLNLAGESGLQLLNALLQKAPSLHIVILTGYGSIATAVEAMRRGAKHYLCKPVTTHEILQAFSDLTLSIVESKDLETDTVSIQRLEWEYIQKILNEHKGNISSTARALSMHRRTLQRKLYKRPCNLF